MPGLRDFLRAGTREAHEALDAAVQARGYFTARPAYLEYLRRSLVFQSAAEQALEAGDITALLPDWRHRRRVALLLDDLATLGETAPPCPALRAQAQRLLGELRTQDRVWGLAYVVEGSTLGAALLLEKARVLGVDARQGATFLAGRGAPPHAWPGFLRQLEAQDGPRFDRAGALQAALDGFSAAHHCLA